MNPHAMPGQERRSLAVVILTHDEEVHIARAIDSVADLASQVIVVDSGSTDRTREIAEGRGALVLEHPWVNYATQFQWALDCAPIAAEWVMRLDADEVIDGPLRHELRDILGSLPTEVTGINLKRRHIFMGNWVRHGGRYPLILLRIWRTGKARIEQRWMDEHMVLTEGQVVTCRNYFSDMNEKDLSFFIEKHYGYATREAIDVLLQKYGLGATDLNEEGPNASFQARIKRAVKERLYNRLPFEVSATGYFLIRYLIQGGFLDGRTGGVYHVLQGLWYRYLVGAKVLELERALSNVPRASVLARLSELTGLHLAAVNRHDPVGGIQT